MEITALNIFLFSYFLFVYLRSLYILGVGYFYRNRKVINCKSFRLNNPLVTIIIPAWNEEVGISKTIKSALRDKYTNKEIIVVNDGSTDNTLMIAKKFEMKYPEIIKVIDQPNGGKASALNHGIAVSKGEVIVTLDADSYIYPRTTTEIVKSFTKKGADAVVGKIEIGNTNTLVGLAQYFEFVFGFHLKKTQSIQDSIWVMTGALAAYKRSVLEEVGDFDGKVKGEDLDYSLRIKALGYKVIYNDKAICISEGPSTYGMLLKQRTRWKFCYLVCMFKHKYLVLKSKKENRIIGLWELPLSFFYLFETAIYPLLLLILIATIVIHPLTLIPLFIFNFVFPIIIFSTIEILERKVLKKY